MSLIFDEQTKLLATALNTAATSCFAVGIATRLAGYVYNVGNLQGTLGPDTPLLGLFGWLLAATCLHPIARRLLRRLRS